MDARHFYIILQMIGVVILLGELLFVINQKPSNIQVDMIIVLLSLIFAFIAYIIELQAQSLEAAMIGCCLGYVGKPFALIGTLYLLLDYSHIKMKPIFKNAIIIYFVILSLIVLSNQYHYLYYSTTVYDPTRIGSPLKLGHGIFWYIYMVSSFVLYGGYVAVIFYEYKYARTKQVKQMNLYLFLMMFFCFIGLTLFLLGWTNGYDSTLFGTLLGSICFMVVLVKYNIFASLTLAKEEAVDNAKNGMVVLDAKGNISYYSEVAALFAPKLKANFNHETENKIIALLDDYQNDEFIFANKDVYKLHIQEYYSPNGKIRYGKSYIFKNVTDEYHYQERLKQEVEAATSRIVQIQKDILVAIADLVEARDGCTGTHIKNVAESARLITKQLQKSNKYRDIITDEYVELVEEVMPLHDIGKIRISDTILNKPGKLTPEERLVMQTHAAIGAEIISKAITNVEISEKVETAKDIAHYHHEWFDGSGYPDGLKGEEIPLAARIAAVSDVYDALRMVRPYKDAFSKEKSIEIIKEESGTHFDPDVVEAFLKVVDKIDK